MQPGRIKDIKKQGKMRYVRQFAEKKEVRERKEISNKLGSFATP